MYVVLSIPGVSNRKQIPVPVDFAVTWGRVKLKKYAQIKCHHTVMRTK